MIDQETQKVKLILDGKAGIVGSNLTADDAESAVKLTEQASRKANCEAFRQWLMQFECHEDVIETCLQKFAAFQPGRTAIQNIDRVALGIAPPGLPQIRTCRHYRIRCASPYEISRLCPLFHGWKNR